MRAFRGFYHVGSRLGKRTFGLRSLSMSAIFLAPTDPLPTPRELRRRTGDRDGLAVLLRDRLQHIALDHMRIGRRLGVGLNRRGWNSGNGELTLNVGGFLRLHPGRHRRIGLVAILMARGDRREARVIDHLGPPDYFSERAP